MHYVYISPGNKNKNRGLNTDVITKSRLVKRIRWLIVNEKEDSAIFRKRVTMCYDRACYQFEACPAMVWSWEMV